MRGEEITYSSYSQYTRITPAHAGRSLRFPNHKVRIRDHPRACGEKPQRPTSKPRLRGSPPRMRGEDDNQTLSQKTLRITPAHAGRRGYWTLSNSAEKDHPRACGEKPLYPTLFVRIIGSPPRMRGEVPAIPSELQSIRITPAHAGRSRGVDMILRPTAGSPPRMRGED